MAYLAVEKIDNGEVRECIFSRCPQDRYNGEMSDDYSHRFVDESDIPNSRIYLPNGTIEKLIGYKLEPRELSLYE
jgi:hypothetical protein